MLKYPQALPHRTHWMGWMKEARRLAILHQHRIRCQIDLWPWQKSLVDYVLSSVSSPQSVPSTALDQFGTMMESGSQHRDAAAALLDLSQGVPVAQRTGEISAQQMPSRARALQQPPANRTVIWLWCQHGHTGKSSLASYLRRHPRINACVLSGGKLFFRNRKKVNFFCRQED